MFWAYLSKQCDIQILGNIVYWRVPYTFVQDLRFLQLSAATSSGCVKIIYVIALNWYPFLK